MGNKQLGRGDGWRSQRAKSCSLSIGSFFFVCGPVVSDTWSIPGKYIVNDFSFVFSYPGGWLDEDGSCETCSLVVTPTDPVDTPEPPAAWMLLFGLPFVIKKKTPRKIVYSFLKRPDSGIPTRTMSPKQKEKIIAPKMLDPTLCHTAAFVCVR